MTTERTAEADKIIRNYMLGAAGAGFVPLPILDIALVTGVQLQMLRSLSGLYDDIQFSDEQGRSLIASLAGGSFSVTAASVVKAIPVIGQLFGAFSVPVLAGASTYAIGKVFFQHFESGGTFLTFDPQKVKSYYDQHYQAAEEDLQKTYTGVKP